MIHKNLTAERWFSFSLFQQLANVGMDVERTVQWRKQGNKDYSNKAFARALELLNLTIADPKNKGARCKELVKTREALIDHFVYDNNEYATTDEQWSDYFYQFNYAYALMRASHKAQDAVCEK